MIRLAAVLMLTILLAAAPGRAAQEAGTPPGFVGAQACASCHVAQTKAWAGSHHALAMQPATPATVLGNFADALFEQAGVTTTFFRDGARFMVRTDGPDGALHDYPVAYTFGVFPLQQYLIAMPGGRYQSLGIAWDSRPSDRGGQRWFHLYPDNPPKPGEPLHWTGWEQTWNLQCADCHSTDLRRNFDLTSNSYATSWTDVNVSCEACHGPGARHVALMQAPGHGAGEPGLGLTAPLGRADHGHWEMNPDTGIAQRTEPLQSGEIDACAACHARRKMITADPAQGHRPFLDTALPAYLEPGLYHADGQIDGEVYEYGSFLQSRMYHAGVTCSDCHDPHGLERHAEGNALCAQCHLPARFDVASHHHHEPGSPGAQCVNCHMPAKTYMGVDVRRDHSFRVPRPDLSAALDTPNTCTQCHRDKTDAWAAAALAAWFPGGRQTTAQYGQALQAGRTGAPDAAERLTRLILDPAAPAIARGSALLLLANAPQPRASAALAAAARDPDPLVRTAAPRALADAAAPDEVAVIAGLLDDPVRAVRIEAARALAGRPPDALTAAQRGALEAATRELMEAEAVDADWPDTHLNLGLLHLRRGEADAAETEYRTALRLDPGFVPAMVNLADLDRMRGDDAAGAALLHEALAREPANASAHHALGLLLVRQRDYGQAVEHLRRASELAPDNVHYAYVYAVALSSTGAPAQAAALLERLARDHPGDPQILLALLPLDRDRHDAAAMLRHARALLALTPEDAQVRALVEQLERAQAR